MLPGIHNRVHSIESVASMPPIGAFANRHSKEIQDAATAAIDARHPLPDEDRARESFTGIIDFLSDNNSSIASVKEEFGTQAFLAKAALRYFKSRRPPTLPKMPSTVPDPIVSTIMGIAFGHPDRDLARLAKSHQQSMASENAVGDLLERYLATLLEPEGWHWCSGTLVRAVDFVRHNAEAGLWESLQVKNRDNSENSSSAAIRNGTPIKHWFRTFSGTGETNWTAFPADGKVRARLSEKGFREFVERTYRGIGSPV